MALAHHHLPSSSTEKPACSTKQEHLLEVMRCLLHGVGETRIEAACEIGRLTESSMENRASFAAAGAILPLVSMLGYSSIEAKQAALLALLNLALRNDKNKVRILRAGAMEPLIQLLKSDDANLREPAIAAILTLSAADANKPFIGASGSIPLLVQALSCGSVQGKVDAVMSLYNLSTHRDNLAPMISAGACAALIRVLKYCKKSSKVAEKVMALLESFADSEEWRSGIVQVEGGLLAVVEVIEEGSVHGREHAVGALHAMCTSNRSKYRPAILREGVIPGLLQLTVQGTERAQRRAQELLSLLRDSPQPSKPGMPTSAVLQSIVYDIARNVDSAEESGSGAAKKMLTEIVQQGMMHLQQRAMVGHESFHNSNSNVLNRVSSK